MDTDLSSLCCDVKCFALTFHHLCFVDFDSAFDSVNRDSLWRIMAADEMPPKLLRLIRAYYASTKMKVRASWSELLPFEIRSGVRQGCALFPTLFNYIIDCILGQVLQDYPGVQVGANVHVSDLAPSRRHRNTQQ